MTPAAGWSKRDLDAEFGPIEPQPMPVVVPSALSKWFVAFKEDVLSGRVSLEELLEVADLDMQSSQPDLCPICTRRPVRDTGGRFARGICGVCWLHRLRDAHLEATAELEALKDYNTAKKQRQRALDETHPDRPRRAGPRPREEYAQRDVIATDIPEGTIIRTCVSCGFTWPSRDSYVDDLCPECSERREIRRGTSDTKSVPQEQQ